MHLCLSITLLIRCIALCLPSPADLLSDTKQTIYCRFALTLREALINAEGLDSIATISEQSKAEAKEAESEGGNKDAEK